MFSQKMKGNRRRRTILLWLGIAYYVCAIIVMGALVAPVASAQEPTRTLRPVTQTDVNQAAQNLYCPVCENLPLAVCYTDACEEWKQQVKQMLEQGYSVEEIEAYFVQRFGQKTVGTPTTPAATLLTIVLPFGLIALIGVGIAVTLIRWRSSRMPDTEPDIEAAPASDPYRERLEADLKDKA
jgi:cytochrome c-type biogenesis protein CcmH